MATLPVISILTTSEVILITDSTAAALLLIKPAVSVTPSHSTVGVGDAYASLPGATIDYGAHYRLNTLVNAMIATGDAVLLDNVLSAAITARDSMSWQNVALMVATPLVNALTAFAVASALPGVTDFNTFCLYYNTGAGGPWTCLLAPDFAPLYNAVNVNPISTLNIYSPAIADMGHQTVGSSFVAGTAVDTTQYAGVAIAKATITGFTGTSSLLTVTGTNHAGVTGRTWTVTVAGNGALTLVPTVATDLLTSVQSFSLPSGMTAGTVTINGLIPAGRTNPPT